MLLSFEKPILMLTEAGKEDEMAVRLDRVGFSGEEGYLDGGFAAWSDAGQKMDMAVEIEGDELAMDLPHDRKMIGHRCSQGNGICRGHVKGAVNIPLSDMTPMASRRCW